jgi:hypothetical protein
MAVDGDTLIRMTLIGGVSPNQHPQDASAEQTGQAMTSLAGEALTFTVRKTALVATFNVITSKNQKNDK